MQYFEKCDDICIIVNLEMKTIVIVITALGWLSG